MRQPCSLSATGSVTILGTRYVFGLTRATATLTTGTRTLTLHFPAAEQKRFRQLLKAGQRARAVITRESHRQGGAAPVDAHRVRCDADGVAARVDQLGKEADSVRTDCCSARVGRGLVLALAGCGGGSSDSGSAAAGTVGPNTTDTLPTNDATTTSADEAIGQGVDQTCEDLAALQTLLTEVDIAHGGDSVDDIEELAEKASEFASKAPAVLQSDLTSIADGYRSYIQALSEANLEPGPDALLVPEVADSFSSVTESDIESFYSQNC